MGPCESVKDVGGEVSSEQRKMGLGNLRFVYEV